MPDLPESLKPQGHAEPIPSGCPGSDDAATQAEPALCLLGSGGAADLDWVLSPGLYPGGLEVRSGTVYLVPGIYWIGGGGFRPGRRVRRSFPS